MASKEIRPTVPRRATIPPGDLILGDGRRLVFQAVHLQQVEGVPAPQPFTIWRTLDEPRLGVIASMDETVCHGRLLHVSVSYQDRDPSWTDVKLVRACFFPSSVDVMMLLPQERDYVNVHDHCFHLWQTPVEWGIQ